MPLTLNDVGIVITTTDDVRALKDVESCQTNDVALKNRTRSTVVTVQELYCRARYLSSPASGKGGYVE